MRLNMKLFKISFALFGFLSVALGAFAAHGLKDILDAKYLEIFHTGVTYQFYHTLALGLVISIWEKSEKKLLKYAAFFFIIGIMIFSGSLYILALTQKDWLGAITPLGGLSFLIGWFFLLIGFVREKL
jgi:uncharacterized membrane protein YgdD (TMEM256/DUF423 family)